VVFTIGYEGLGIERFVEILTNNGVKTLLDCRYSAFSRNPDFRKNKLASHLYRVGIGYDHLAEYGIPSEIRNSSSAIQWYITNVKPMIHVVILEGYEQPVCFMCMEKDIQNCHRKIILEALQEQGIEGRDLYPTK
jgi:uncharacterized protein (DUF488 family)